MSLKNRHAQALRRRWISLAALSALATITVSAYGQVITWDGSEGDQDYNNADNWDLGDVPNTATESAVIGAPAPTDFSGTITLGGLDVLGAGIFNINGGSNFNLTDVSSMSNAGVINVATNTDFRLGLTSTNNGEINLDGSGATASLELSTSTTLNGTGFVFLNGPNAQIDDASTVVNVLTNGVGHTIRGSGNISANTIDVVNDGIILADLTGQTMTLDPASGAGGFTNNGTLQAINGGTLLFNAGGYINTTSIEALADSTVEIASGVTIIGGTLATPDATGSIEVLGGVNSFFTDVTNTGRTNVAGNTDFGVTGTFTNTGALNLDGTGVATDFELQSDVLLTGDGTVTLVGPNAGINDASTTQFVLIQAAGHTIQGEGDLGDNTINVVNNSLIDANAAAGTLTLDPAATFVNTDTLRASDGGILEFAAGSYDNTGGTIEALEGSIVQLLSGADITAGLIDTPDATGAVAVVGGANVFLADLTTSARIEVAGNTDFGITGTIINNGSISLDGTGVSTDVELQTNATLAGNGTLVMDGPNAGINDATTTQLILTNGVDHSIVGEGDIGDNTINVVNNGTILANVVGGTLSLDPAAGVDGFVNNGTLDAIDGGNLALAAGGHTNSTTINAFADSSVTLLSGVDLTGGTLDTPDATGEVNVAGGANVVLTDVTNDGRINVGTNTDFGVTNSLTNNGVITLDGSGASTDFELQSDVTLGGTGSLLLDGPNAGVNDATTTQLLLTQSSGHTIEGEGDIGDNAINLINAGTVEANVGGASLTIDPAETTTNTGTFRASSGGTLQLAIGEHDNTDGTYEALAGSTLETTSATAVVTNLGAGNVLVGGTYRAIDGTLNISPIGFDLAINNATIELYGLTATTDLFDDAGSAPGALVSGNFDTNNGTFRLAGGAEFTSHLASGASFVNEGTVLIGAGSTFTVDDNVSGVLAFVNGSPDTLMGEGTLVANLVNELGGVVSPGDTEDAIGVFTVDGTALLSDSGTLVIDIAGTGDNDLLVVTDLVTVSGTIEVDLLGGFVPEQDETFLIIAGAADLVDPQMPLVVDNSPLVDFVTFADLPNGDVYLQAVLIPEPAGLGVLAAAGLLLRRRRAA
ncbi:MAG: hypothetical protein AAGD32_14800 [Planctomycetota bacterium]